MVSTRQMSTTASHGAPGEDICTRFPIATRQSTQSLSTMAPRPSGGTVPLTSNVKNIDENNGDTSPHRKLTFFDMPIEIIDKIFSYVGYKKVGQMRVLNSQMDQICKTILNSKFSKLQTQMLNRFQTVKAKMPRRESARRNHPLACECDIIETCYMRLSLLQMTFGKHIERKHCCFFPGGILDEVYNVLNYIRTTPKLERPFKVTDELFDLSTMAMEFFKDHIEPKLPEIGYFNKDFFDLSTKSKQPYSMKTPSELSETSSQMPSPPQSNMVLRKGIRKIKQGMKMYNNQLTVLRSELRTCKRKSSEQGKQIAEQQKLIADQQKQTLEYANRLDENDKKNEEMSRKFSTLLQELNKCKTELQYWRSKSPATQVCTSCGQKVAPVAPEDFQALINQGVNPANINVDDMDDSDISNIKGNTPIFLNDHTEFIYPGNSNSSTIKHENTLKRHHDGKFITSTITSNSPSTIADNSYGGINTDLSLGTQMNSVQTSDSNLGNNEDGAGGGSICSSSVSTNPSTSSSSFNEFTNSNPLSTSIVKKARKVQNKFRNCHTNLSKRSK